jgi:hypothetical protein
MCDADLLLWLGDTNMNTESGQGIENGREGMLSWMQVKVVSISAWDLRI